MNKGIIFDLDGTIYYGDSLAPYAKELIDEVKQLGYEVIFFTNNSTKSREKILSKIENFGIDTTIDRIYTSSFATAKYLDEKDIREVFLIGTSDFNKELNKLNIKVVSEFNAKAVVIGLDENFSYNTISKALIAVNNGASIIASNKDSNYPIEHGVIKPGSNAILASLLGCCNTKTKADYIVGKPNTYLLEIISKDWNLDKNSIYVVGDSIDSDIAMANNYNCKSILIADGQHSLKDIVNIIKKGD